MKVEIEVEDDDWDKSYTEYIRIRLDEEETTVKVVLQTKPQPTGVGLSPGNATKAGTVKVPPAKLRSGTAGKRLIWFSVISIILILIIVAVVNSVNKSTPSQPALIPSPQTKQAASTPKLPAETTLVPTSGLVDTTVTLKGVRFTVGKTVSIAYDGNQVATAVLTPEGAFSATFIVPASQPGPHTITASDGTNVVSKTFTVLSPPPLVPVSSGAESVSITKQVATTPAGKGILTAGLRYADGKPIVNRAVYIYTQKQDVTGEWVMDRPIEGKVTDNGGMASFDLTPGQYAIKFRRPGENTDRYLYSITVEGGKITSVVQ